MQKLAKVMAETRWVEKKGRNSFFNYDYARETDILDAVRTKLADNGIFVFTSVENMEMKETGKRTRDGSPVNLVIVKTKHTFWDGESGETAEVFGTGCGEDSGDKAIYKAITGAMKYFISKNFLISTGDDPEKDDDAGKGSGNGQTEAPVRADKSQSMAPGENASATPMPQFESPSASPTPLSLAQEKPLSENPIQDYVVDIQSRSGPKRDGTTYTRYSVQTRNHGYFTTFNTAFADLATDAKNGSQEVVIRYKSNGRWKDIESIRYAEGAYVSPAFSEADALPF
ncbi:MAG: hypothetical protein JWP91_3484 [Fibrobacteres bacterium]|nr:hypothetical protein [Fibrobacterota bacterium]